MKQRTAISIAFAFLVLVFGLFIQEDGASLSDLSAYLKSAFDQSSQLDTSSQPQGIKAARVIDGDTIELEDGRVVRYIGVNTPELKDSKGRAQCFAEQATIKNRRLIEGKYLRLEKDVSETDRYGRLLRYVYAGDTPAVERIPENFINLILVQEGFAQVATHPPDVSMQDEFKTAQAIARQELKGLWASCTNK